MTTQTADPVPDINTDPKTMEKTHFSVFLMALFQYARADDLLQRNPNWNLLEGPGVQARKSTLKVAKMKLDKWIKDHGFTINPIYPNDEVYAYIGHLLLHVSGGNILDATYQLFNELHVFFVK